MSDTEDTKTTPPATDADKPLLLRRPSRPYDSTYHHHVVPTERCGALNVFVQGDLEEAHRDKDNKCVFLTVHDIGGNHKSFERFVDHYAFEEIKKRAIFVHIDCPGQEEDANDLDKPFPTIQALGEDLVTVLDQLRIKYCIGLGDGAGANVIVRFAMMHVTRTLGIILLNPTASTSTMMESFKDKLFAKLKMHNIQPGENPVYKRYSSKIESADDSQEPASLIDYREKVSLTVNPKNMKQYMDAFLNRTDVTVLLSKNLRCDALLVAGAKSGQVSSAETMHHAMDKTRTSLLKIDDVADVLEEAPIKLANAILLFCKGLGWLTSVTLPGVERRSSVDSQGRPRRQRSISMEEYDKPNIRRLSITAPGPKD